LAGSARRTARTRSGTSCSRRRQARANSNRPWARTALSRGVHRAPLSGAQRRTCASRPSWPRALEDRLARNWTARTVCDRTIRDRLAGSRPHRRRRLVDRARSSLGHNHARSRSSRALRRNWRSLCGRLRRGRLTRADLRSRWNWRCQSLRSHRRRLCNHRRRCRRRACNRSNRLGSRWRSNYARRCNARRWRRNRSRRFRNGHRGNRLRRRRHGPRGRRSWR